MHNEYYSDSDDDLPSVRVFRERINFNFRDQDFLQRFRVSRTTFEHLYERVGAHFHPISPTNHALSAQQNMLVALHWLGTGCQFHGIGDMHGVSESTARRIAIAFSNIMVQELLDEVIRWPEKPSTAAQGFFQYAGIPNVAGAVDEPLINIKAPENEAQYVDRHGNHSLNVMMICGPNLKFYAICAKMPGSTHDSRVLRNSRIAHRFDKGWRPFPNSVIIADSGYPIKDWLVPYRPPRDENAAEQRMYFALKKARHLIECGYGGLKLKFPCLQLLKINPIQAANVVMTCAILHNLCIDSRIIEEQADEFPEDFLFNVPEGGEDVGSIGLANLLRFFQN